MKRPPTAPPGPSGSFLLGSARELQRDQLGTYARVARTYGDVARIRVGPPRLGFEFDAVFTPEAAHRVLAADAGSYVKDAPAYEELARVFGDGLLSNDGDRWRRHRRIVQPLFTRRRVADHAATVADAADDLAASWAEAAARGGEVDLHATATGYALQVLGRAVLGDDVAAAAPTLQAVLPVLNRHVARRGLAPVRVPSSWPTPSNRRAERARRALWALVDDLVARRRADATAGDGGRDGDGDGGDGDRGRDLLGLLLSVRDPDDGRGFDDGDVRDEVLAFLVAGHETTGAALALTLHLLARHPEVQDRVRAEVAAEVGDEPLAGVAADVDRVPVTTAVVHEALRLYPLGHTLVRRAVVDTTLLDRPVPPGRIVAVSIWGIHRNPAVWPDPDRFDPDRFSPEQVASRHRYAHLPFGGGPRACIGAPLAMAELVVAVAALVRRHRLESPVAAPPLDVGLTVRPQGVLSCRVARLA